MSWSVLSTLLLYVTICMYLHSWSAVSNPISEGTLVWHLCSVKLLVKSFVDPTVEQLEKRGYRANVAVVRWLRCGGLSSVPLFFFTSDELTRSLMKFDSALDTTRALQKAPTLAPVALRWASH